ncbi:hypothetical protein AR687_17115 [Flavobacteriaceae bacterium CRH]|nr:hypothetical protein AR687_17115 [Flavobacteriaceae bacterium CRH]
MVKIKYKMMEIISNELLLSFETQDWGIINADSKRVKEFIIYWNDKIVVDASVRIEFFELIIASYNDALLDCIIKEKEKSLFINFLSENIKNTDYRLIIDYWIKIKSNVDYPVGFILAKMGTN